MDTLTQAIKRFLAGERVDFEAALAHYRAEATWDAPLLETVIGAYLEGVRVDFQRALTLCGPLPS